MALPTTSRQELRKKICKRLGMTFFRRFDETSTLDASSTTLALIDAALTQGDDYWAGTWLNVMGGSAAGDIRYIVGFSENDDTLFPDRALSNTPQSGSTYQLLDIFSPFEIHDAINHAIRTGSQFFPGTDTEQPFSLAEDKLEYSLTGFSNTIWKIYKLYIEKPTSQIRDTVSSATSTSVTMPSGVDLTDVNSNWIVSCYDGTGAGEWQQVSSVASQVITTPEWTTTLDDTSKVTIYDPTDQKCEWEQITAARFDPIEYPSTLYLTTHVRAHAGSRVRVQYIYKPTELSSDSDTTVVPEDYVIPQAIALLYKNRSQENAVDRAKYANDAQDLRQEALAFAANNSFNEPSQTVWQLDELSGPHGYYGDDPLDWY